MIDDSIRRLPFCIGVIGDFRSRPLTPREQPGPGSFVRVTVANFDTVLRDLEPRIACHVENTLTGVGHLNVDLRFAELDDFDARQVAGRFGPIRLLLESREELSRLLARLRNNQALTAVLDAVRDDPATVVTLQRDYGVDAPVQDRSATDDLLSRYDKTGLDRNAVEVRVADALRVTAYVNMNDRRERAANLLRSFVTHVGSIGDSGDLEKALEVTIVDLDYRISAQLDRIMHAPDFVRLEASWRGLARLVNETEPIGVQVRLLDLQQETLRDFAALDAISRETDVWGGNPVTVIVNDFPMVAPFVNPLQRATGSLLLDGKSILISAASPELLGLGSFTALDTVRDLRAVVDGDDTTAWNAFRESRTSLYQITTLPRVLVRRIGQPASSAETFAHEENVEDINQCPWGSAAFLLAEALAKAFADHPFCGRRVQGPASAGEFKDLPFRPQVARHPPRLDRRRPPLLHRGAAS